MFGDLDLFSFVAFMEGNDGTTCTIRCLELEITVRRHLLVAVAIVAMDLKLLLVIGLVVNGGCVCHLLDECD